MLPIVTGIIGLLKGIVELIPWLGQWLKERAERKAALRESENRIRAIENHSKRDEAIDDAIARELAAGRVPTATDEKPTSRDNPPKLR